MSEELSDKQKIQIQDYLGILVSRWMTWLGIANIATLIAALIYVFFILPDKAASEAITATVARYEVQNQSLINKIPEIYQLLGRLNHAGDEVQRTISSLRKKAAVVEVEYLNIEEKFKVLKINPEYKVAEAIEALNEADTAKEILSNITVLTKKLDLLEKSTRKINKLANNMPAANYDSGWIIPPPDFSNLEINHNLKTTEFKHVAITGSRNKQNQTWVVGVTSSGNGQYGYALQAKTLNSALVGSYKSGGMYIETGKGAIWTGQPSHIRIRIWK